MFINKCLRRILNIHWPDRITNKELWKKTNEEPVLDQLGRRKWNWIGHTLRKSDDSIAKNKCYSGHHKATEKEDDKKHVEKRSGEGDVDSRLQV